MPSFLFSRVMVSDDAGMSWADTGFSGELVINDLKLGIDGQNLYASTVEGVWRLPLGAGRLTDPAPSLLDPGLAPTLALPRARGRGALTVNRGRSPLPPRMGEGVGG